MKRVQIARVVVELCSPMSIGSGASDELLDAPILRDADGLPALPGSSVGGVLRSEALARHEPEQVESWFGRATGEDTLPSKVWVSWGRPHNSADRPVAPRLLGGSHADPVLELLRGVVVRDRVRLNSHGVVDGDGKFDRSFVAAGARFTLELRVDPGGPEIRTLVDWLHGVSVGGATSAGFGRLKVVRASLGGFDLKTRAGRRAFQELPRALWEPVELGERWAPRDRPVEGRVYELVLRAEQGLLIGGRSKDPAGPDLSPFQEQRVRWSKGGGAVKLDPVLPGTALRGALRHRSRFHLAVLCDAPDTAARADEWLFGSVPSEEEEALRPGRVRVEEVVLPDVGQRHRQMHVCLDRFTMGPRDGMLFEEESLWIEGLRFSAEVRVRDASGSDPVGAIALRALERSVDDLCEGRLGLGHGNSRGHGFFSGEWEAR